MQPLKKHYGPGIADVTVRLTTYDKTVLTYLCHLKGVKPADVFRMFLRQTGRRLEEQGKLKRIIENDKPKWKLGTEESSCRHTPR